MSNVDKAKQALANAPKTTTVLDFMQKKRDLIAAALPNTITPDRLIGIFTMLLKSSPALMECTQSSLVAAVIQTVQLGLTPGNIGHCHFVPFNNKQKDGSYKREVQFIIGYRGIMELVNRSRNACILSAECVYDNDDFEFSQGLNPSLRHIPADGERGAFKAVYCIAKNMLANEKVFIVLNKAEIDKVKASSKAGSSQYSPWNTWPDEMAKKTAIKRICKILPVSLDVQQKISTDETIKTEIDSDMATLPDKTNWEDAKLESLQDQLPSEPDAIARMRGKLSELKGQLGNKKYYEIIGSNGFEHSTQIPDEKTGQKIIDEMNAALNQG